MNSKGYSDVLLIGAGIMSGTLAALLKELDPNLDIDIYERLDAVALESSHAWNNAGTGHSALCELNYTPEKNGNIDITKALKINEAFEVSKQFWTFLLSNGYVDQADQFIHKVPHLSLVWEHDIDFLKKRHEALTSCHLFSDVKISQDREQLKEWMPLIMEDQDPSTKLAATFSNQGTDVDFGAITRNIFKHLKKKHDFDVHLNSDVQDLWQDSQGFWRVKVENTLTGREKDIKAKYVFIGAGGGALPLLDKSDIPEGDGYGGFPVGGQWLVCYDEDVIAKHGVKVYGNAALNAPPMSVPHLDTRYIDGKKALLFGPYAGFTTKFLKEGSWLDLPKSIDFDNIATMFGVWIHNFPLTKYLISQVMQSDEDRMDALRQFLPNASSDQWKIADAGKRVQILKRHEKMGGILEFGTEVITSKDKSLSALLGASPGASTATSVMLKIVEDCFPELITKNKDKLLEMIPSYAFNMFDEKAKANKIINRSNSVLGLDHIS